MTALRDSVESQQQQPIPIKSRHGGGGENQKMFPPPQGPQTDSTSYPICQVVAKMLGEEGSWAGFTSQDLEPNRAPFSPHTMRKAGYFIRHRGGSLRLPTTVAEGLKSATRKSNGMYRKFDGCLPIFWVRGPEYRRMMDIAWPRGFFLSFFVLPWC